MIITKNEGNFTIIKEPIHKEKIKILNIFHPVNASIDKKI
jgi:hypothetical protein